MQYGPRYRVCVIHHTNITRSALDRVVRKRLLQGELSQPEGCLRL
jgi:hypothetical protein